MVRFNPRGRLPDRSSVTKRLPDEETRLKMRIYGTLALALLALLLGATMAVAGLVFIPMMAFAYSILGVLGAAAMLTVGVFLSLGAYLWLTGPA